MGIFCAIFFQIILCTMLPILIIFNILVYTCSTTYLPPHVFSKPLLCLLLCPFFA